MKLANMRVAIFKTMIVDMYIGYLARANTINELTREQIVLF
jgi:hypothetical protein